MRPNSRAPHATPTRRLIVLLLLLGGVLCAGCEERGSIDAQALCNDIVLRIRALEPPTFTLEMMPPEPLTGDLLLETTTLAGFEPTMGGRRKIVLTDHTPGRSDLAIHPHQLGAFNDNISFAMESATEEGETRGAGGSLWVFNLMFSRLEPGEEQVLSALKLSYKNHRVCEVIERAFAETPSHGLCSRRLIREARVLKHESEIFPQWNFCAATPSRRDLVWIECRQSVEDGNSYVTYNIIKRRRGDRKGAALATTE